MVPQSRLKLHGIVIQHQCVCVCPASASQQASRVPLRWPIFCFPEAAGKAESRRVHAERFGHFCVQLLYSVAARMGFAFRAGAARHENREDTSMLSSCWRRHWPSDSVLQVSRGFVY